MQVKHNPSIDFRSTRPWILFVLKSVVMVLCFYFLFVQYRSQDLGLEDLEIGRSLVWMLLLQLALMVVNWYLEIRRWQISVQVFEMITMKRAALEVLTGLALNWILPFTAGDFAARLVTRRDRLQGTAAIVLNRAVMMTLTALMGLIAIQHMFKAKEIILLSSLVVLALIAFRLIPAQLKVYFDELAKPVLLQILALSIIRYSVYLTQFAILIHFFEPDLSWWVVIAGVGWVFFVRSFVPSFFGGLGLREASALFFFGDANFIWPVFIIWIINAALPALIGTLLIGTIRLSKR